MSAPKTYDGWFALHAIHRVDWRAWRVLPAAARQEAIAEAEALMGRAEGAAEGHLGSSGHYWLLGQRGDLLALHLRGSIDELSRIETDFAKSLLGTQLQPAYSYLSVVELSTHGVGRDPQAQAAAEQALRGRLEPDLPRTRYICFYPMSKLRGETRNWYMLSAEERGALMRSHGQIGRSYQDRVEQIVTGSMGLDDWEWGVDLFADDPLQFKKIVYEMRFDEVSARYALFGSFFVGMRLAAGDLGRRLLV